jgi:hypothetical protein
MTRRCYEQNPVPSFLAKKTPDRYRLIPGTTNWADREDLLLKIQMPHDPLCRNSVGGHGRGKLANDESRGKVSAKKLQSVQQSAHGGCRELAVSLNVGSENIYGIRRCQHILPGKFA